MGTCVVALTTDSLIEIAATHVLHHDVTVIKDTTDKEDTQSVHERIYEPGSRPGRSQSLTQCWGW